jgi:hypothetical protein
MLCSCRDSVRYLVDKYGAPSQERPPVYHAVEGFAPGKNKNRGIENHDRYYYYISPDPQEMMSGYQSTYNNDYSTEFEPFDEKRYWEENHLEFPEVNDAEYYQNLENGE